MLTRCEAGLQAGKNNQCNAKYWQDILLISCY